MNRTGTIKTGTKTNSGTTNFHGTNTKEKHTDLRKGKGKGYNGKGYRGKGTSAKGGTPHTHGNQQAKAKAKGMSRRFQKEIPKERGTTAKATVLRAVARHSRARANPKARAMGYRGQSSTTIFDGTCRRCGHQGTLKHTALLWDLGFLGTCDDCGQTGHNRRYCPVEIGGKGNTWNDGKGYSQEEPEQDSEGTCIACLSEGEEVAFGGCVGGCLASVRQPKEEEDDDVWVETRELGKGGKKATAYAEAANIGGTINTVGIRTEGEWEVVRGQTASAAAVTICGKKRGDVAEDHPATRTEKSKNGVYYISASDDPIYNLCEERISAVGIRTEGELEAFRGQVDSAAAATICGRDVAEDLPATKTEKSKKGVYYMSASDYPIDSLGEMRIAGIGEEWTEVDLASQLGSSMAGLRIAAVDLMDKRSSIVLYAGGSYMGERHKWRNRAHAKGGHQRTEAGHTPGMTVHYERAHGHTLSAGSSRMAAERLAIYGARPYGDSRRGRRDRRSRVLGRPER